MNLKNIIMT